MRILGTCPRERVRIGKEVFVGEGDKIEYSQDYNIGEVGPKQKGAVKKSQAHTHASMWLFPHPSARDLNNAAGDAGSGYFRAVISIDDIYFYNKSIVTNKLGTFSGYRTNEIKVSKENTFERDEKTLK